MEYYNNTLAVEASWLFDEQILSKPNYDYLKSNNRLTVIRRGCMNTPALVAYDSLPTRFKEAVIVKLGNKNPYNVVKTNLVESYIQHSARLSEFFENYKLSDGRNLPKSTRKEYYANAIVLEAIGTMLENKHRLRSSMGKKLKINWEELSEGVQELDRSKYPHDLPVSYRRLGDKYKRYKSEGEISLIHKNFQNNNAARVDNPVKESVITELIADSRNLDNAQVAMLYNTMAEQVSWQKITAATVAVWRERHEMETYAGRRGSSEFRNKITMQVKRKAPSFPLYFWSLDGWDVELLYQKTENGTTTYHHRPTVVVVLDACLKYPIGYAVGTHETPELTQQALRNAVKHTAELFGKMHRTQQLQSDRYAIKKLTPYYDGVAEKVTPARVKNAKAKVIEPYFGGINKRYCQMLPNWSGFGITSNKEKQPNVEFLNKYKGDFPDFAGVCRQIDMIIERERTCDGKQERFLALWAQMPAEHKIELSYENYLLMFGETTGFKNTLEASGLNITIRGLKRHYDCFDISFRKYASTAWEIRYDPDNLTQVLAVNEDETRRYILEEKYIQPMALRERKNGDSEQLHRIWNYNKDLEQEAIDFRANNYNVLERASIELPEFRDTLQKLLITDKNGQHKDNRNRVKMLKQAEKLNSQYEDAVLVEDVSDFKEGRIDYLRSKVDLSIY